MSATLRKTDFNIICIQEIMPGTADIDIIKFAIEKEGCILTEDKDFGDELVFKKFFHNGAMFLRLDGVDIIEKKRLVLAALNNHREELMNAFSVLSRNKLRIRKI
ncbi:MAG: DUF5615 family PIN-like protein [Ginsengibacter sp.]